MPRFQKNDNFIDKTFTVIADIVLKVLPASKQEKEAFAYYRDGMSAQSEGEYAEALENYYEALRLEEDPYDRSYILYNIGLIYASNGEYIKALEYYDKVEAIDPDYEYLWGIDKNQLKFKAFLKVFHHSWMKFQFISSSRCKIRGLVRLLVTDYIVTTTTFHFIVKSFEKFGLTSVSKRKIPVENTTYKYLQICWDFMLTNRS